LVLGAGLTVVAWRFRKRKLEDLARTRDPITVEDFAAAYFHDSPQLEDAARRVRVFLEANSERSLPFLRPDDEIRELFGLAWPHLSFATDLSASVGIDVPVHAVSQARTVGDLVRIVASEAAKKPASPN